MLNQTFGKLVVYVQIPKMQWKYRILLIYRLKFFCPQRVGHEVQILSSVFVRAHPQLVIKQFPV